ncbi:MAG: hypothetical protein CO162_02675 [bacterium (Candidatus Ratteibacteria) CG_4_9_14_3_um_filter_41_21]|uniref:Portal protein n=1 Tax=bacterium (Candidatus Ratteibacteria) CG_4_9_14_3_um_filter_41_21 TaxID=2014289 RepID=A0A2M7YGN9_9BACT|nr:MAG: hypothetical protein CO162_02675 [bacterium (Candidatus Ratteibacteria) CG_4_9_14_3_um_filter_41_21]
MTNNVFSARTDDKVKQYLESELWANAFEYRKSTNFGKNAISYWEAHNGNHWDARKVKPKKAAAVLNQIGATVEDILSNITDAPPMFDVIPNDERFKEEAEILKDVFNRYLWRKSRMDTEIQLIERCALVVGSGHFKTAYDADKRAIITRYISPFSCFPAPYETRMDDMTYYIHAQLMPKIILQERFGNEIKDIKKTRNLTYEFMPDMEMEAAKGLWAGIKESARQVSLGLGNFIGQTENVNNQDRLLIREFWVKDLTSVGGQRKYPTWRYYVMVEDIILKSADQVWRYPFIPIIKIDDYVTEGYWGRGEIEWMLSPQFLINKFMSQICNYMDLVANPPIKAEQNSGVTNENWVTRAGEILHVNMGFFDKVDFMRVPALPPEFVGLINNLLKILDSITGQHAGMPTRTAAQAMLFSEAEQSRTRPKTRNMENGLLEWAEQCKEYIKQHWMSGKKITFRDDNGDIVQKEFKDIDALDELGLTITTGSTVASTKLFLLSQLERVPELDLQTRLELMGFPNPKQMADKVEAKQGELTQLKLQMGQMLQENRGLQEQLSKITGQIG